VDNPMGRFRIFMHDGMLSIKTDWRGYADAAGRESGVHSFPLGYLWKRPSHAQTYGLEWSIQLGKSLIPLQAWHGHWTQGRDGRALEGRRVSRYPDVIQPEVSEHCQLRSVHTQGAP